MAAGFSLRRRPLGRFLNEREDFCFDFFALRVQSSSSSPSASLMDSLVFSLLTMPSSASMEMACGSNEKGLL